MITHVTGNGNETCPRHSLLHAEKKKFSQARLGGLGTTLIMMLKLFSLGLSAYAHILIVTDNVNPLQKENNAIVITINIIDCSCEI